jgi:outer membrane murein-binding lipoprotein Lpp
MSETIIVALIGVGTVILSGTVSAWISARSGKRKVDADAAQAVSEAAASVVKNLIGPLNARIDQLEKELNEYKSGVEKLIKQIRDLGHKPSWTPVMGDRRVEK